MPRPGLLVALTGALEALGALGLLLPATASAAGWCLATLLVAMFPANVYAARSGASLHGRTVTPLGVRATQQVIFIAAGVLSTF